MAEIIKRKVGRPVGRAKCIHTITIDIGLLESLKRLDSSFKLSTFINEQLRVKLAELEG